MWIVPPLARPLVPALLVAGLASVPSAQTCGNDVVLNRLDAGVVGPELATPDGAPVVGGPFRFRVEGALPNTAGAMVFSPVEAPFFSPDYGATFWFGSPFGTEFFVTDAEGRSPGLTVVPEVDPFFCNEFGIFQAGVFDATATGGVAVTNAIRLRVGDNGNFDFPLARKHDSLAVIDVATGDFDEDGLDDVVTLVSNPFQVELRLGADLESATVLPAGVGSQAVAVDDLDGDGHLDLAVANLGSDDVSILLGNGDGTFASAVAYAVGDGPASLAVALLNGDAALDLVVANQIGGTVSLLKGNGDGTFQAATTLAVGPVTRAVVVGDWDGDLINDLAVVRFKGLDVLTGNGDLTFDALPGTSLGGTPVTLAAGDFDEDDVQDLVVLHFDLGVYHIRLGNGDGTFTGSGSALSGYFSSSGPEDVLVTDADGDGHVDLLVGHGSTPLSLIRGNGDGTFAPTAGLIPGGQQVALGDTNGDGRDEIVAGGAEAVLVRRLQKSGAIVPPLRFVNGFHRASAADVTGDGLLDYVVASGTSLEVFPGVGGGAFGPISNVTEDNFDFVATGDLDGDRVAEIVTWDVGQVNRIDVYRGGSLALADDLPGTPISSVRIADASGDGIPDLVFIDELAGQKRIAVHRGNGDGTLGTPTFSDIAAPDTEMILADVNGDGVLDAIHAHFVTDEVAVRLGTRTGFFLTQIAHPVGLVPEYFAAGDFDGDSNLDLAVSGSVPFGSSIVPSVKISLGNGDGTFQAPFDLDAGEPRGLQVGDVDGDGRDDLVVDARGQFEVHVFRNQGGATFARTTYALRDDLDKDDRALLADADGDGIVDLLVFENDFLTPENGVRTILNQLGE